MIVCSEIDNHNFSFMVPNTHSRCMSEMHETAPLPPCP